MVGFLNDVDHGVHNKEGLEGVLGVLDAHIDHEVATFRLSQLWVVSSRISTMAFTIKKV